MAARPGTPEQTTAPICVVCNSNHGEAAARACTRCADELRDQLIHLARIAGELEVTVARQSRTGRGCGDSGDPLPVNLAASYDADAVVNVITTWAREVARGRGLPSPTAGEPERGALADVARWLADQVDWMRRQPDAAEAFDELDDACHLAVRVVDRGTARWYAGPCGAGCEQDLYAQPGALTVVCPKCRASHDAIARKQWLLGAAQDTVAWAGLIAAAIAALGLPCTRSQIAGWAHRGRLAVRGVDQAGRVLYRVGDVIALAQDSQRKQEQERERGIAGKHRSHFSRRG
ncbi:MAG: hypothetical protein JXA67_18790 [Micromonosporaceae bacterium]|nr:hypothetical protein [Micromonosporaceae bacterium]